MIKAGNATIQDKGFVTAMEIIGGVPRQAIILELPSGIDEETLVALCSGPIEVLDEQGQVVQTHTGPFRMVTHGIKLTRESASHDVSALTARVSELESELTHERSAHKSAQNALASLRDQFTAFKETMATTGGIKDTLGNLGNLGGVDAGTSEKAVVTDGEAGV